MAHPRKLLRQAVTEALSDWPALAGYDVKEGRTAAVDRSKNKALSVFTPSESSLRDGRGNPLYREVTIVVIGHVRGADPQDLADDLAEIVEAAMRADETFSGACRRSHLTATAIDLADGDPPAADIQMSFSASIQSGPAAS